MRTRLIESRLTPNAISLTGLIGNVIAAVLVWLEHYYFLAGIAFVLGSVCDTLDGRYSPMSGKGTPFGAFLDSTLDRAEEGIVLAAVCVGVRRGGQAVGRRRRGRSRSSPRWMVSYTRARAESLGVENKGSIAHTGGARRDPLDRPAVRAKGAGLGDFELLEPAVYVLAVLIDLHRLSKRILPRALRPERSRARRGRIPVTAEGSITEYVLPDTHREETP